MSDVVLDYNQVIEETPVTGDTPPTSGGLITFQFKCDVNGATDLSNSFFAADCIVESVGTAGNGTVTVADRYIPDSYDFHAFPMLRCFQSVTHIIDGQTVCNSQHPYADALIVEKFLTTHSKSNIENFQALSLCKQIDNGMKEYNIFAFDTPASMNPMSQSGGWQSYIYDWAKPGLFRQRYADASGEASYPAATEHRVEQEDVSTRVHTLLFQPPFDLWRLRQPFHGGIHQVQFNLKAQEATVLHGGYMTTTCVGLSRKGALLYDMPRLLNATAADPTSENASSFYLVPGSFGDLQGASAIVDGEAAPRSALVGAHGGMQVHGANINALLQNAVLAAESVDKVKVEIKRLRFLRRVVRTSVPPQLSNVQYNFTEISMQHGTPTSSGVSQQFLLPSTTFGLVFYWRDSTNSYYDQIGVHPSITRITGYDATNKYADNVKGIGMFTSATDAAIDVNPTLGNMYRLDNTEFDLNDFQFTYGGATYPMQRISNINGALSTESTTSGYGWHRLMTLQNQLQGVYNSTMDDFPNSYGAGYGKGVLNRMDPNMMFFPVSRTGNSDNGILQVEYTCKTRKPTSTLGSSTSPNVQLVVVALYDAQLNMQYSSNELQQIVLTQFK